MVCLINMITVLHTLAWFLNRFVQNWSLQINLIVFPGSFILQCVMFLGMVSGTTLASKSRSKQLLDICIWNFATLSPLPRRHLIHLRISPTCTFGSGLLDVPWYGIFQWSTDMPPVDLKENAGVMSITLRVTFVTYSDNSYGPEPCSNIELVQACTSCCSMHHSHWAGAMYMIVKHEYQIRIDEHMDVYHFMWILHIICTSTRLHVEGISM